MMNRQVEDGAQDAKKAARKPTRAKPDPVLRNDGNGRFDLRPLTRKAVAKRRQQKRRRIARGLRQGMLHSGVFIRKNEVQMNFKTILDYILLFFNLF